MGMCCFFTRHGHGRAVRVARHAVEGRHRHHWVRGHPEVMIIRMIELMIFRILSITQCYSVFFSITQCYKVLLSITHMPWPWL